MRFSLEAWLVCGAVVLCTLAQWRALGRTFWRGQRRNRLAGAEIPSADDLAGLIGFEGEALETFSGAGKVRVAGEVWRASLSRGIVERGERVRVVGYGSGLVLQVERIEPS
jgi:membrane-bound ClpP family serine protease